MRPTTTVAAASAAVLCLGALLTGCGSAAGSPYAAVGAAGPADRTAPVPPRGGVELTPLDGNGSPGPSGTPDGSGATTGSPTGRGRTPDSGGPDGSSGSAAGPSAPGHSGSPSTNHPSPPGGSGTPGGPGGPGGDHPRPGGSPAPTPPSPT
ncbi:hypothetical protein MUU72_27610, partial [Streptomyces sp. RS10V-4]|nr:hypothetical protein [Streptomyces rhizoryzae]